MSRWVWSYDGDDGFLKRNIDGDGEAEGAVTDVEGDMDYG